MNAYRCSIIAAVLCFPLASFSQELTLGVEAETAYDSNVFSSDLDEVDDTILRIEPRASLEDHEGELQWELSYRPSYDYYLDVVEARGWSHLALGELSWQVTPTTRVAVNNLFGYFRSLSRFNEVVAAGGGDGVAETTQDVFDVNPSTRNNFNADLSHNLSPTQQLTFSLGYDLVDYQRERSPDRNTLSGIARYLQTISRRNQLGGGINYRRSNWDGTPTRRSQSTDFFNVFGNWIHSFDETLELSVAVGPTWVKSDGQDDLVTTAQDVLVFPTLSSDGVSRLVRASSCPTSGGTLILTAECDVINQGLTPGEAAALDARQDLVLEGPIPSRSDQSLTYFANMSLIKTWEQWTGSISYRRQQSQTSGLGSSTIADIVSGALEWTPSPRWVSTLRATVTRQTQENEGLTTVVAVVPQDVTFLASGRTFTDVAQSTSLRAVTVDQELELWTFFLNLRVGYRITERTTLFGTAFYWDQRTDTGIGREYNRFRIGLGVEYRFDPIRL